MCGWEFPCGGPVISYMRGLTAWALAHPTPSLFKGQLSMSVAAMGLVMAFSRSQKDTKELLLLIKN